MDVIDFKQLNQETLNNSKSDILRIDAELNEQIESVIQTWLDNQKSKKFYNAINSVMNPTQSPLPAEDFSGLKDLLVKTYSRIISGGKSDQYDQSLDLSSFGLKKALFTLLKHRRQAPDLDEIIDDLEKFSFRSKVEHHKESVRTMLRYYSDKKGFIRIDESEKWSLTAAGEKFFTTESNLLDETVTNQEAAQITAPVAEEVNVIPVTKSKNKPPKLAVQYARIIRESGKEKMHITEIADLYNKQFNQNVSAHNVGSALNRDLHSDDPNVKAFGDNWFGDLSPVARSAEDESAVSDEVAG